MSPSYFADFCIETLAVSGRSGLRSAVREDLVVPGHKAEWGSRAFAVASPSCWNELPVELRDLSVGPETFVKNLNIRVCLTFCRMRSSSSSV